ncbi:MAG: LysE family translocator [Planctomycetota bacterium]
MPELTVMLGFMTAALIVLVIPGPGVVYIVARSVSQGSRAGLVSALGLSTGAMVHVLAAAVGLSALLLASATAFAVVKWLGVIYLMYLGVRAFLDAPRPTTTPPAPTPRAAIRLFGDGVVVSVLNPKIAMFFLAFLPQFVQPERGVVALQILLLGTCYAGLALVTDGAYALLAGRIRHWLMGRVSASPWPRYATGTAYVGMGISAAFTERK